MKSIALLLCLTVGLAFGQSLPDAPSSVKKPAPVVVHNYPDPIEQEPSHTGRTIALVAIVGGILTTALLIGLLKHSGSCPSYIMYDGNKVPYSGTYDDQHKCPTVPPGEHDEP